MSRDPLRLAKLSVRRFWDLHTWLGLVAGLVLYFMCLTGSITLFNDQISTWQSPASGVITTATRQQQLDTVFALHGSVPDQLWYHPTSNGAAKIEFEGAVEPGQFGAVLLDMHAPALVPDQEILAGFLYNIHYLSHDATGETLYDVAGFLAVAFLLVLVTGVLIHLRDFVRQFFQFRPRTSTRTLWSDMHKVLGVMGLPFQLLYAYTGAYIILAPLLTERMTEPVFAGQQAARERVLHGPPPTPLGSAVPGPRVVVRPIDELVATALAARPDLELAYIRIDHHGRDNGLLEVGGFVEPYPRTFDRVVVREIDGSIVYPTSARRETPHETFDRWLGGLHYVRFGGMPMRFVFLLLGLATCATILTGNWVWLARRAARAASPGHQILQRLTAGIGAGSIVAVGAMFLASRLLPLHWITRGFFEQLAFFGSIGGATIVALLVRTARTAWSPLFAVAGLLFVLAPIAQARLTTAGLLGGGPHVAAIVGVDLGLLVTGVVLLLGSARLRRA